MFTDRSAKKKAMAEKELLDLSSFSPLQLHLLSAFLAMEPPFSLITLARVCGGGSITEGVQNFIWDKVLSRSDGKYHAPYLRSFLKKFIMEIESTGEVVLDEMYEKYTSYVTSLKDYDLGTGNSRVLRWVSFLFSDDSFEVPKACQKSRNLVIPLRCSLNMLEGDTGCCLWPSSLFLSEYILSCPALFANKSCFEVGSGVGLVGICLAHVKASKVILSDGDLSTLANMKLNLELNQLTTTSDDSIQTTTTEDLNLVQCIYLPWESAQESELQHLMPDIVLGADVIYDPSCFPHLVRVLTILLNREKSDDHDHNTKMKERPIAYIASVIRNSDTFNHFLTLAGNANLSVKDITNDIKPSNFLPYMLSYPRSNIRLLALSYNSL